jgi:hypothetical protein
MRSLLFWDFTRSRLVVNFRVLGQPTGPSSCSLRTNHCPHHSLYKYVAKYYRHSSWTAWSLKTRWKLRQLTNNLRCVKTQMSKDLISTAFYARSRHDISLSCTRFMKFRFLTRQCKELPLSYNFFAFYWKILNLFVLTQKILFFDCY